MLEYLEIRNFALIDKIEVNFKEGLNVIIGETGAGKSLLLESLLTFLNEKIKPEFKNESKKSIIEAHFSLKNNKHLLLENLNDSNYIILRREFLPSGYSRSFINDSPTTFQNLKKIASKLIDFHQQNSSHLLSNENFLFNVIDSFCGNIELKKEYSSLFYKLINLKNHLKSLEELKAKYVNNIDYLKTQYKELCEIKYSEEEFKELENKINQLNNASQLIETLSEIEDLISNNDYNIISLLRNVEKKLLNISHFIHESDKLQKNISDCYFILKELLLEVSKKKNSLNISEIELIKLKKETDKIYNLLYKYRLNDFSSLIELRKNIENQINDYKNLELSIENLNIEIDRLLADLEEYAEKLRKNRLDKKKLFEEQVLSYLKDINLDKATFYVNIIPVSEFNINGKDDIQFLFAANPDQEVQEIHNVASGGEISRFLLSIKSVVSNYLDFSTIIFDEIDTGISGDVSYKVGKKLKDLSKNIQVIVITHSPQIAVCASHCFLVEKQFINSSSVISIKELVDFNEKIYEIAKLISPKEVTKSALNYAKELYEMCNY